MGQKCYFFLLQQKCQDEQQRIVQLYLRSAKKEHKQMLERKAVIEARKEYLESLHVKRVSVKCLLFLRWSGRGEMRAAKMFFRLLKQTEKDHQLTFLLPSPSLKFS